MGAVDYAENTLDVHGVYEQAQEAEVELRDALAQVTDMAHTLRRIADETEHREFELACDIRAEHHGISQEALKRELRESHFTDEQLSQLRDDRLQAQHYHDEASERVQVAKYRLKVLTARMAELGGLLNFYAATKAGKA